MTFRPVQEIGSGDYGVAALMGVEPDVFEEGI